MSRVSRAFTMAMVKEAGFDWDSLGLRDRLCFERLTSLTAAAQRQLFALECIDLVAIHGGSVELEAAIRARGQA